MMLYKEAFSSVKDKNSKIIMFNFFITTATSVKAEMDATLHSQQFGGWPVRKIVIFEPFLSFLNYIF